ncbi:hypothetical protein A9179_20080 [Pseudomonas alcaligenes]|uniref:TraG N-terminal Proteobacteria domain-containing protein n=1 Tax=Aquipseudomonas alcaligenes TaxID=43263 RepID=A0ABR7S6H1_AQUAC|nr:hypothetical protein [Pseudomonas alcaligenes]MBC9252569.1 hypothetical protein [Pseudomonas alcaligenes]
MDSNSLAGLSWLFSLFDGVVDFLLLATEPFVAMIGAEISGWLIAVGYIAMTIIILRIPFDGPWRAVGSGLFIFMMITYGLQPTTLTLTSGATVQTTHAQRISYNLIMSFNQTLNSAISKTMATVNVDGQFIPTAALVDHSVQRTAAQYANSDLGRLIRDYNEQCSPSPNLYANPASSTEVQAYHAIGLLGGAGLGIPDDQVSRWAQVKIVGRGLADIAAALNPWSNNTGGVDTINSVLDADAIRTRRAEGLAALEKENRVFVASSRPYTLPTQEHWAALASGQSDAKLGYLSLSEAPEDIRENLVAHAVVWTPEGGKEAGFGYNPMSCVEAYKVAQFAAEQAYRAFTEIGDNRASNGQSTDTEAGSIAAGRSWMKIQQAVFAGGPEQQPGHWNTLFAGTVASWQMLKSYLGWLELQTLLPAYVAAQAGFFWLVFLTSPIALAMSPIMGVESLAQWFGRLFFPVLCIIFAHLLAVSASVAMSSVALAQAALSAGWQGGGADLDLLYGALQMVFGVLLAASTWLAASMTRVSVSALARTARSSVVSGPEAVSASLNLLARSLSSIGLGSDASKGKRPGPRNNNGGGGGANRTEQHPGRSTIMQDAYSSARTRSWTSNPGLARPPQLNQPASNSDRFATGRIPRSQKNRPSEKDPT